MLNYFNDEQKQKLKEIIGEETYNKIEEFSKDFKLTGFVPKSRLDDVIKERDTYKNEKETLTNQYADYETLKNKSGEYEAQITKLNDDLKNTKINSAIELSIIKEKGKNTKAISALLDMEKITLTDDGKIEGLEDQLKSIKENNSYMFDNETTKATGTNLSTDKTQSTDLTVDGFMKFM